MDFLIRTITKQENKRVETITINPHPLCRDRDNLKIEVKRNSRARRIILTVRPSGEVKLTLPRFAGFDEGLNFVKSKMGWIAGKLAEFEARAARSAKDSATGGAPASPLADCSRPAEACAGEATEMLKGRAEELSVELGLPIRGVTVRKQRTRWGSCTAKNHINLNIRLAGLPPDLVDYVIIHELVHTRVKNHGPEFWRVLDEYLPGAAALRDLLKGYSAG